MKDFVLNLFPFPVFKNRYNTVIRLFLGNQRNALKIICRCHYKVSPLLGQLFNGDFLPPIFLWENADREVFGQTLHVVISMHIHLKQNMKSIYLDMNARLLIENRQQRNSVQELKAKQVYLFITSSLNKGETTM